MALLLAQMDRGDGNVRRNGFMQFTIIAAESVAASET